MRVVKKQGKIVQAYKLGAGSAAEHQLMTEGKIRKLPDGRFELFSQETDTAGEIATAGDYFKVDNAGYPYPNSRIYFKANHKHLSNDEYMQMPKLLEAWTAEEPMREEIQWLVAHEKLSLHPEDEEKYFQAFLWGVPLSAAKNAVVVFYSVDRDTAENIMDISFNFVARDEFDATYDVVTRKA